MKPEPGDKVKVTTSEEEVEGILMPNEETDSIVVKLDSGYNVGIENKKVKDIKVIKKSEAKKESKKESPNKDPKKPTISILHTGGTIASKVDYRTGGVVSKFTPEDIVSMYPELLEIANIESELIANMWSDDLRFANVTTIAKKIEKVSSKVDGIIISMGTDNLAVASAALSFAVEKTPIPIIFVGSQRSSDRGSSDAAMNLICAAKFIAGSDFSGVALCMHKDTDDTVCSILPAAKTKKLHTSRRDAFKPVNDTEIADIDYKSGKISFITKNYQKKSDEKLIVKPNFEEKVGIIKIQMNMFPEQFSFFKGWKGLIIEGTGLGQTPGHVTTKETEIHRKIFPAIKEVIDSGCFVVMTSNCIFGRVNMHVYDKARDLSKLGVISGEDMLTDTAFAKLSWLLANHKKKEVKDLISQNLRGEINERIGKEEFLD